MCRASRRACVPRAPLSFSAPHQVCHLPRPGLLLLSLPDGKVSSGGTSARARRVVGLLLRMSSWVPSPPQGLRDFIGELHGIKGLRQRAGSAEVLQPLTFNRLYFGCEEQYG